MKILQRIGWLVLAAATLTVVLATVAAFGGSRHWQLDLLANLRAHYLFALVLFAALFALGRRWRWASVCGAAAAINLVLVGPVFLPRFPAPPADPDRAISVMALNIKVDAAMTEDLVAYLRRSDDDLVFLFAATVPYAEALHAAAIPHHVVVWRQRLTPLQIILLARDPEIVTAVHWLEEEDGRSAAVEAVVDLGGTLVRVLGTHPLSPTTSARAARRDRQIARLSVWADRQTDPVLIVGDLNATPWSHGFRSLLAHGGLVNSLGSRIGLQPSWPAPWDRLGLPIDHAVHSPELVTIDRYLGPSFGSDHRALHITVAPAR